MGLFNQFPFTNFHELNLDWLINTVKTEEAKTEENTVQISEMKTDIITNTQNISSNTDRIATLEQNGSDVPPDAVNVRKFGAYGDAVYYDLGGNKYYSDSAGTPCHDDTSAIDAAMAYALAHDIHTLYFPDGAYLYKGKITLDISKMRFVGENNSALVSEGLTSGSFITLTGPLDLKQYNFAKSPLYNINLWGAYYNGLTKSDVTGIEFANNFVPCHLHIENVSIVHFNNGAKAGEIYKSVFTNVSFIACGTGVFIPSGTAVPVYFANCFFECCGTGVYCALSGYSQLNFVNCAFEYNRQTITTISFANFVSCRFEYDNQSAINPADNTAILPFQWGQNDANTSMINFSDCQFLDLHHYPDNVKYWIDNPVIDTNRSQNVFYLNSSLSAGVHFDNCSFSVESFPTSNYYMSGTGIIFKDCKVTGISESTFINPSAKATSKDVTYL